MELHYKKNDNSKLFSTFESFEDIKVSNIQNYIPIYKEFFSLTENNSNTINLNHNNRLHDIIEVQSYNICRAKVLDNSNAIIEKEIFFKFSPLLDPIKYLVGKYDISNASILDTPNFGNKNSHNKIHDINNASYTDGFFSFLSSKLLNDFGFVHGTDFYGAFLGKKHEFKINIYDELEYLQESKFFCENKNKLFYLDNKYYEEYFDNYTKNMREPISIQDILVDISSNTSDISKTIIDLKDIHDISFIDTLFAVPIEAAEYNEPELMYTGAKSLAKKCSTTNSSSSSCSSRLSNTDSESASYTDSNNFSDSNSNSPSSYSTATEDNVNVILNNFPIEIIALERCENTLDSYILREDIRDDEFGSIVMQLLMMLITFQKVFHMTHNDLHTNNIMYISTKKEFLHYKFQNKYYKVPTYGKIYKIIDFGRAIYHFRGIRICSDSFHKDGDGATQYNCEPYYNKKKPVIEPNYSFDLCRLSCSMFDFLVDDLDDIYKIKSPIIKIILGWCNDDNSRNVLYKSSGKERYPDFKLYKMIARTVHGHVPSKVIENEYFSKFIITKKKITKNKLIMNIDKYPECA